MRGSHVRPPIAVLRRTVSPAFSFGGKGVGRNFISIADTPAPGSYPNLPSPPLKSVSFGHADRMQAASMSASPGPAAYAPAFDKKKEALSVRFGPQVAPATLHHCLCPV